MKNVKYDYYCLNFNLIWKKTCKGKTVCSINRKEKRQIKET